MCGYQGHEFGSHYLDSVCIDGYLWDADSGDASDDGWVYTNGGDQPCPQCNHDTWRDAHAESVQNDAWVAVEHRVWPFGGKARYPEDRWWLRWHQLVGIALWARDFVTGNR